MAGRIVSLTGGSPWGFRLVGGCDFRASLAISKVTPGGKASRAGLMPGDVITSINQLDTSQMTHLEAQNIVKGTGHSLTLGISSSNSTSPTSVAPPAAVAPPVAPPPAAPKPAAPKTYQSSTTIPIGKPAPAPVGLPVGKPATFQVNVPPPVAAKPAQPAAKPWSAPKRPSDFIVQTPAMDDDLPPPPPSSFPPPPPAPVLTPPAASPLPPAPQLPPPKQDPSEDMESLPPPPDALTMPTENDESMIELFCEGCKGPIRGPYLTAQGKNWHPECFVCATVSCKKPLQNIGFIEEGGKRYCSQCYEKFYANICAKCGQKIIGEVMHALGKTWHVSCFVCVTCSKPFRDGVFHMEGDKPYCIECYNQLFSTTCKGCGFRIEAGDGYVEAIKSSWHETCFNCAVCHVDLKNCGFFAISGKPVCSNHKNAQLVS